MFPRHEVSSAEFFDGTFAPLAEELARYLAAQGGDPYAERLLSGILNTLLSHVCAVEELQARVAELERRAEVVHSPPCWQCADRGTVPAGHAEQDGQLVQLSRPCDACQAARKAAV